LTDIFVFRNSTHPAPSKQQQLKILRFMYPFRTIKKAEIYMIRVEAAPQRQMDETLP
jgi:hypothetical protein